MAGYTDAPMRGMARRFGADITYTEMISARALVQGHKRTASMLDGIDRGTNVVVQLMGTDPSVMAEAGAMAESMGADGIDINLGCAVRKIVRNGAGAALMRDPSRVGHIVRRVREAIRIPLSVKMRAGWDAENRNAGEVARIAEGNGVDAVAIHGRLASEGYRGQADWAVIRDLVETLAIPVVGNGDIRDSRDAEQMIRQTNCTAVMVGRASLGNPWIFRSIQRERAGMQPLRVRPRERIEAAKQHLHAAHEAKGRRGVLAMRKHLSWYLRGFPGVREVRNRIHRMETVDGVMTELDCFVERLRAWGGADLGREEDTSYASEP
jgi:tRNA-dihydrouridine synthase B